MSGASRRPTRPGWPSAFSSGLTCLAFASVHRRGTPSAAPSGFENRYGSVHSALARDAGYATTEGASVRRRAGAGRPVIGPALVLASVPRRCVIAPWVFLTRWCQKFFPLPDGRRSVPHRSWNGHVPASDSPRPGARRSVPAAVHPPEAHRSCDSQNFRVVVRPRRRLGSVRPRPSVHRRSWRARCSAPSRVESDLRHTANSGQVRG